ncbi:DUF7097 family protein [Halorubrum halodurans]|uniref:Uncharacterized protein n=1 Tax=Halorubrum halodurans TaxID=1383851 RepID=A0A256IDE2_9EURY|nr:hypothetical protein [Halorubrum halodurans]OYR54559.1 hypothetical protein DJ70_13605 [Halorubrum halodurans]
MERTPEGTPVGIDDPYAVAGACDHLTDDGRCRFALTRAGDDPAFAAARRADDHACHVGPDAEWRACPHYRSTTDGRECARCGLAEVRLAHEDARPLVEEHHLSYGDADDVGRAAADVTAADDLGPDAAAPRDDAGDADRDDAGPHEITVALCRWCHAKVHTGVARVDDDASPDPEAIAAREGRRTREREESAFSTARERYGSDGGGE